MAFLDKFERKFRNWAIPNLTLYLVLGQAFFYLAARSGKLDVTRMFLVPSLVMEGQWWRLIAFLLIPPASNIFFIFFVLYLFYLMGTALENHWGSFRYNIFLLTGYALTVAVSFLTPDWPATNTFLGGSVFLAFALLFPEFQLYLFFVLPVKIKWLAVLAWIGYGWSFISGGLSTKLMVLASIGNVLLFFGRDIIWRIRTGKRKMTEQAKNLAGVREPFHRCAVCGKTDISNPEMDFRYCPECGGLGYCMEHIDNHEHRKK
jgi:hypothetical protein